MSWVGTLVTRPVIGEVTVILIKVDEINDGLIKVVGPDRHDILD